MAGMELTTGSIELICEFARRGDKISAIKELRQGSYMGLREARDFIETHHQGDVSTLRNALLSMAEIHSKVYENQFLRIEFKTADVTFGEAQRFMAEILRNQFPNQVAPQPSTETRGADFFWSKFGL